MEEGTPRIYSKKHKFIIGVITAILLVAFSFVVTIMIKNAYVSVYTVEYVSGNNDVIIQKYNKGEKINFPENPERLGYQFVGWALGVNDDDLLLSQDIIVDKQLTLYAKWKECEYTILYNGQIVAKMDYNDKISFNNNLLEISTDSQNFIIDNPYYEGKTFNGWQISDGVESFNIDDFSLLKCSGNALTLLPIWVVSRYNVTIYNEANYEIVEYSHGQKFTSPNISRNGYQLVGFKNQFGEMISSDFLITSDIELYAVWQKNSYSITFPNTNGAFVIICNNEYITNGKTINLEYLDKLSFEIALSKAYGQSNVEVVARTNKGDIILSSEDGVYTFDNVDSDIEIMVNDVNINSYNVIVDGKNYGTFVYGSWIWVDDNKICITNSITRGVICIGTLVEDNKFGGWVLGDGELLVHNYIQDLAINGKIEIVGNYSRNVCRISLVSNGGVLEMQEIIYDEDQSLQLPEPKRNGYKFEGWFVKLVEVNMSVDKELSHRFDGITGPTMVLYAGWSLIV